MAWDRLDGMSGPVISGPLMQPQPQQLPQTLPQPQSLLLPEALPQSGEDEAGQPANGTLSFLVCNGFANQRIAILSGARGAALLHQ